MINFLPQCLTFFFLFLFLFVMGFFKIELMNYLPSLASNHSPPDLCLLHS
jgi:hypothetical protein